MARIQHSSTGEACEFCEVTYFDLRFAGSLSSFFFSLVSWFSNFYAYYVVFLFVELFRPSLVVAVLKVRTGRKFVVCKVSLAKSLEVTDWVKAVLNAANSPKVCCLDVGVLYSLSIMPSSCLAVLSSLLEVLSLLLKTA